ncbi:hypothetical protein Ddc_21283 [Ditylenchus destructor]|nr:hypothetical protein Ddc_21283 [Ditylenchus destructor]
MLLAVVPSRAPEATWVVSRTTLEVPVRPTLLRTLPATSPMAEVASEKPIGARRGSGSGIARSRSAAEDLGEAAPGEAADAAGDPAQEPADQGDLFSGVGDLVGETGDCAARRAACAAWDIDGHESTP